MMAVRRITMHSSIPNVNEWMNDDVKVKVYYFTLNKKVLYEGEKETRRDEQTKRKKSWKRWLSKHKNTRTYVNLLNHGGGGGHKIRIVSIVCLIKCESFFVVVVVVAFTCFFLFIHRPKMKKKIDNKNITDLWLYRLYVYDNNRIIIIIIDVVIVIIFSINTIR